MDTDLLAWARVVVRDLYQLKRLRLQTSMFLCTLEPKELRDIQMYFYPLWQAGKAYDTLYGQRRPPVLKQENKTGVMLVQELEALVSSPLNMEILSAGVGFGADLTSGQPAVTLAAALGGHIDIVQSRILGPDRAWEGVEVCATIGGHLELLQLAYQKWSKVDLNMLAELAAKYDRLPVLQWVVEQGTLYPYFVLQCMKHCCHNRNPTMLRFLLDRYPTTEDHYRILLDTAFEVPRQKVELIELIMAGVSNPKLDWLLDRAAANQEVPVLELLLTRGATDLNRALSQAAYSNTAEVVTFLLDRGATDLKRAFHSALRRDRLDIARLMIRPGVDLNQLLGAAARAGNTEALTELIELGATDFNSALVEGIEYPKVVRHLLNLGADNLDRSGNERAFSIEMLNQGLLAATEYNQLEVTNMLIDAGANNLDEALLYLLTFKDESYHTLTNARLLVERGASNINQALLVEIEIMSEAHFGPSWKVVRRLIELGANNLDQALELTLTRVTPSKNRRGLVEILVHAGANGGQWPASLTEEEG